MASKAELVGNGVRNLSRGILNVVVDNGQRLGRFGLIMGGVAGGFATKDLQAGNVEQAGVDAVAGLITIALAALADEAHNSRYHPSTF